MIYDEPRHQNMNLRSVGMSRWIYGVFVDGREPLSQWGMTRDRKAACKLAKERKGVVKRLTDNEDYPSYDAPTFWILAEYYRDYRAGPAHELTEKDA